MIVAAIGFAALTVLAGSYLVDPPQDLITQAAMEPATITPNADGDDDVTLISYTLSQPARVSIVFTAADGVTEYDFRDDEPRESGLYRVQFSGVVDGYTLEDETVSGQVLRRLIPEGTYTWRIEATAIDGDSTMQKTGTLTVQDADSDLPELIEFTVAPAVFTPNQDGRDDRTMINLFVNKAHERLDVFLVNAEGDELPLARRDEGRLVGEPGRHMYDYEGGVDIGADPPPDGAYEVVAQVQDAVGQVTQQTANLVIQDGGNPQAEILAQSIGATVAFIAQPYDERYFTDMETAGLLIDSPDSPGDTNMLPLTVQQGDMLVFKLTVDNYGPTRIRTSGPPPGTVYQQTQLAASLGAYDQSGAWRVGLQCETSEQSYPWRWGLGTADTLEVDYDPVTDNTFLYLPAGEQAVVWGAIRLTEYNADANPMACWAGLIHEDVEISLQNTNVGRREIEIAPLNLED